MPGSVAAFVGFLRRKRNKTASKTIGLLFLCAGLASAGVLAGCGGSNHYARAGTYAIPVTLTPSGGTAQIVNATVIVEQ